jgi:hypothetical protein
MIVYILLESWVKLVKIKVKIVLLTLVCDTSSIRVNLLICQ